MNDKIKKMSKVELHLHLDGAMSVDLAIKLSGLSETEVRDRMIVKRGCYDLSEYLTKFSFPISLMQTKKNLELVAKDLVDRLVNEKVIYAEIRFAPVFHTKKGLNYDEIVGAVLKGLKSNKNIKTNLILCLIRGESNDRNCEIIEVASRYLSKGVCAIDIAGDEGRYPLDSYFDLFLEAKKRNIPFTIHAGEVNEEEVEKAINLGAKRLGHGIKCVNQEKLMDLIKKKDILLEICPNSNIDTNVVDSYLVHPIYQLYKNNMKVCVNTDNPTISNVTLTREYQNLVKYLPFSLNDLKKMNLNAIDGAFISDDEKDELKKIIGI